MFLEVKHFGSFETSSPFKFVPRVEKCFHREIEKRMQYMTIRDSKKTVVNMLRMKNTPFTVCFYNFFFFIIYGIRNFRDFSITSLMTLATCP